MPSNFTTFGWKANGQKQLKPFGAFCNATTAPGDRSKSEKAEDRTKNKGGLQYDKYSQIAGNQRTSKRNRYKRFENGFFDITLDAESQVAAEKKAKEKLIDSYPIYRNRKITVYK